MSSAAEKAKMAKEKMEKKDREMRLKAMDGEFMNQMELE